MSDIVYYVFDDHRFRRQDDVIHVINDDGVVHTVSPSYLLEHMIRQYKKTGTFVDPYIDLDDIVVTGFNATTTRMEGTDIFVARRRYARIYFKVGENGENIIIEPMDLEREIVKSIERIYLYNDIDQVLTNDEDYYSSSGSEDDDIESDEYGEYVDDEEIDY